MKISVEDKLSSMMRYLLQVRAGYRTSDAEGFNSFLDDPELADWYEQMDRAGRTTLHTRTIGS